MAINKTIDPIGLPSIGNRCERDQQVFQIGNKNPIKTHTMTTAAWRGL